MIDGFQTAVLVFSLCIAIAVIRSSLTMVREVLSEARSILNEIRILRDDGRNQEVGGTDIRRYP